MAAINKAAQAVIDRLAAVNYDEPYWNEEKVIEAFRRQYEVLGIPMPEVEVSRQYGYRL
jgi:hypothetical protein